MEPWYKVTLPRPEVREGCSFNPDEFAIALEQVVAGTAPLDYRDPVQFFARTCFTRALREHAGMVLRRLAGKTENSAPVLTLIPQFGGGKTHTLALLYHLVGQAAGPSSQAGSLRHKIAEWTKQRGKSPRLYPGSLVWCVRKPGRDLKEKIEVWLAWKRVEKEINDGTLGGDFDRADRTEITTNLLAPGASLISLLLPFSWVHPAVAGYCSNTERS